MNFYKIERNTDEKIIGKYPQVDELTIDYHKAKAPNFAKIDKWASDKDIPNLMHFKLNMLANISDSLTNSFFIISDGLLLSKKTCNIFENYKLLNTKKYDSRVYFDDDKYEDFYLYWYKMAVNLIKFTESKFLKIHSFSKEKIEEVIINSMSNFKEKNLELLQNSDYELYPKRIVLKEKYDFFSLFNISGDIIVSERLKNAIEEAKLTGFQFKDLDYEVVVE